MCANYATGIPGRNKTCVANDEAEQKMDIHDESEDLKNLICLLGNVTVHVFEKSRSHNDASHAWYCEGGSEECDVGWNVRRPRYPNAFNQGFL